MLQGRVHQHLPNTNGGLSLLQQQLEYDYEYEDQEESDRYPDDLYRYQDDSEEEYMIQQNINTTRIEEIPVKEPMLNAVPKKSALKKRSSGNNSGSSTPSSQDTSNRPLVVRQDNNSSMQWVSHGGFDWWYPDKLIMIKYIHRNCLIKIF